MNKLLFHVLATVNVLLSTLFVCILFETVRSSG